mmetsp:Transcript_12931/g.19886  ORF Transcript_12931/g.19886 Transcript_12931/m.19886 type:complete len:131 (-) Transcript_12931:2001-2393(-)
MNHCDENKTRCWTNCHENNFFEPNKRPRVEQPSPKTPLRTPQPSPTPAVKSVENRTIHAKILLEVGMWVPIFFVFVFSQVLLCFLASRFLQMVHTKKPRSYLTKAQKKTAVKRRVGRANKKTTKREKKEV